MDFDSFARLLRSSLPKGLVLTNPSRGTSTIMWCDEERVCYRRGNLRLYIGLRELHTAYLHFVGGDVTTRQLKDYCPKLFDSTRNGHDCHCTFFFMALQQMGVVNNLWGRGLAGSPFGVTLPAVQAPSNRMLPQSALA
jgi:hypothetical protein